MLRFNISFRPEDHKRGNLSQDSIHELNLHNLVKKETSPSGGLSFCAYVFIFFI